MYSYYMYLVVHVHTLHGMVLLLSIQRPTAQELLKHKFLKQAKKTSYLVELVDRYKRWKAAGGEDDLSSSVESRLSRRTSGDGDDKLVIIDDYNILPVE